ncbi:hypothetical protein ACTXJG_15955 [Glutamicibacter arilaitensis]|uniref:hypothetical protein n=1 Tax=Glutamicibacter arilaitensis TaxID=256701 RepID=UPI003FD2D393
MSYFGKIDALDSRRYIFNVPPNSVPLELIVQSFEGVEREFVLLPEQSQIENFSKKCVTFFSQGLDAKFQYVGGGVTTLTIGTDKENVGVQDKFEFVIARWARNSVTPFPKNIRLTTKDLSLDPNLDFVEVISAKAQHNSEGK